MLAKVIVSAPSRSAAVAKLSAALKACHIAGTVTNIAFLIALCELKEFAEGDVDTGLIERNLEWLTRQMEPTLEVLAVAATAALQLGRPSRDRDPWSTLAGWRLLLESNAGTHEICVVGLGGEQFELHQKGKTLAFEVIENSTDRIRLRLPENVVTAQAVRQGSTLHIDLDGQRFECHLLDGLGSEDDLDTGGDEVTAPMPGFVKLVTAQPGARLTKGDALLVLEAMKMEHTLRAPRDGVVAAVFASPGDHVQNGAVLIAFEAENG
jgi:3-methylcrotonyl-CoA carboxylase alpha subunit